MKWMVPVAGMLAIVGLTTTSCAHAAQSLGSAAIRTLSAKAGAKDFKDHGYPIDGELTCRGGLKDHAHSYSVDCDGKSTSGKRVTMTVRGVTNHDNTKTDHVKVVGKADGKQVFKESCLDHDC